MGSGGWVKLTPFFYAFFRRTLAWWLHVAGLLLVASQPTAPLHLFGRGESPRARCDRSERCFDAALSVIDIGEECGR
jgi:hypothetical protein